MDLEERYCGHCGKPYSAEEKPSFTDLLDTETRIAEHATAVREAKLACERSAENFTKTMAGPMIDNINVQLMGLRKRVENLELAVKGKRIRFGKKS